MLSIEISPENKKVITQMRLTRTDIIRKKYLSNSYEVCIFLNIYINRKLRKKYTYKKDVKQYGLILKLVNNDDEK